MDIKRVLRKFWKTAMKIAFGLSFIKDVILIVIVAGAIAVGIPILIALPLAVGVSFVLNFIGYTMTV